MAAPRLWLALVLASLTASCGTTSRLDAIPQKVAAKATLPGFVEARYFMPADATSLMAEYDRSVDREVRVHSKQAPSQLATADFLALSGGADDGAFGAGLLEGWSASGRRPEFKLVTGISTGALIAPFAFLGQAYDRELKEVFTTINADLVFQKRFLTAAFMDDALADTSPLFRLISKYLDDAMIANIAAEYDKGRLLLILTTDLDAARPVIWNIGAIAKKGGPEATKTIRRVLLASAAIPGAFPPVMFDVEYEGKQYQELHVDGGPSRRPSFTQRV